MRAVVLSLAVAASACGGATAAVESPDGTKVAEPPRGMLREYAFAECLDIKTGGSRSAKSAMGFYVMDSREQPWRFEVPSDCVKQFVGDPQPLVEGDNSIPFCFFFIDSEQLGRTLNAPQGAPVDCRRRHPPRRGGQPVME